MFFDALFSFDTVRYLHIFGAGVSFELAALCMVRVASSHIVGKQKFAAVNCLTSAQAIIKRYVFCCLGQRIDRIYETLLY